MRLKLLRIAAGSLFLQLLFTFPVQSQCNDSLSCIQLKLLNGYNAIFEADAFHRDQIADKFYDEFFTALSVSNNFDYPFDTLQKIGKIYSPDKRIRIFSWNIPVGLSENLYYCIIQYYSKNEKTYRLVKLNSTVPYGLKRMIGDWHKTMYFQIVENKHAGQIYYTLLGFDFYGPLSNIKSIDVISIDEFDQLYFCERLFQINGKIQDRVIFEYNEKAVMMLRYDDNKKMIVFDHLAPSQPSLEGKFEFYGPDFTYDGLKFGKGIWTSISNIDITN